jgi:hypothetical protein
VVAERVVGVGETQGPPSKEYQRHMMP